MKKETTDRLVQKYPQVFKTCKQLQCADGWEVLIDSLCSTIEHELKRLPQEMQDQISASQIKEKFGGLRFYMNHETPFITGAISLAEHLSNKICEVCGVPGKHCTIGGWMSTLCAQHEQETIASRKKSHEEYMEQQRARKALPKDVADVVVEIEKDKL